MNDTILERQTKNKEELLDQLKKTPIVQISCEKTSVSRATYYRWRKEDKEFSEAADTALLDGNTLVNDLAESKLLSAIRNQNLGAIIFWLKHHHPSYTTRLELSVSQRPNEELTPAQQKLVKKALDLASLTEVEDLNNNIQNP